MNSLILNKEVQEFIRNSLKKDLSTLILKGSPFEDITIREIAEQAEAMGKAEKKLPTWFGTPGIYYPPTLSIEQTSSEITARYKARLVSGDHMVDITGGLGIDDYFFARRFSKVVHCEINKDLSEIAAHNFSILHADNIECHSGDGLKYLESIETTDLVYADPARRDDARGKVFLLSDCTPDIVEHLNMIFTRTPKILIKTSPMLDIQAGLEELKMVSAIHIVAVRNEVKELLWMLERHPVSEEVNITAVNLDPRKEQQDAFTFSMKEAGESTATLGKVANYLYEPNAAIMKSGAFNLVSKSFHLDKLHPHTHLYSGNKLIDFPGRRFRVIQTIPYNKKEIKRLLGSKKVNITTRNFPESVATLRKKFKLKDGGQLYAFFCTGADDQKMVVLCEKL